MADEDVLYQLLARALKGDQGAASDLVRRLQPVIRRAVRVHLPPNDPLRRLFDSADISQSVLLNFLAKAGREAFAFRDPKQLRGLLRKMAAEKFIDKKREAEAQCRDRRRETGGKSVLAVPVAGASPDEIVADRELYHEVRRRFTPRERLIADLWLAGHTFAEIAERLRDAGGQAPKPNAVRMAMDRAFHRVAEQLRKRNGEEGTNGHD